MHSRQTFILATLRAVQGFMIDNNGVITPVNDSGARKSLDALIREVTLQAVDQDAGRVNSRGETALQSSLRKELRELHMKRIATIARARLHHVPEMRSFMLPSSKTPPLRLVAMAGGMADAATKHAAVFIERGLPQDFIVQLTTAADALSQSLDDRAQSNARSAGATTALSALAKQAVQVIDELDVLISPKLAGQDRLMGEWCTVKRIRRKPGRATESTTSTVEIAPTSAVEAPLSEQPAA